MRGIFHRRLRFISIFPVSPVKGFNSPWFSLKFFVSRQRVVVDVYNCSFIVNGEGKKARKRKKNNVRKRLVGALGGTDII